MPQDSKADGCIIAVDELLCDSILGGKLTGAGLGVLGWAWAGCTVVALFRYKPCTCKDQLHADQSMGIAWDSHTEQHATISVCTVQVDTAMAAHHDTCLLVFAHSDV